MACSTASRESLSRVKAAASTRVQFAGVGIGGVDDRVPQVQRMRSQGSDHVRVGEVTAFDRPSEMIAGCR